MSSRYNFRNRKKIQRTSESTTDHEEQCESSVELNVRRSKRRKKPKQPNTGNKNANRNLAFILKRLGLCTATPTHPPSRPRPKRPKLHSKIASSNSDQQTLEVNSGGSALKQESASPEIECSSEKPVKGEVCNDANGVHTSYEVPQAPVRPESPLVHKEMHTTPEIATKVQQENTFNVNLDCVFRRPLPIQSPLIRDHFVSQICNSSTRYSLSSESPRLQGFRTPHQSPVSKLPYYSSEFTIPSPVGSKSFSSPYIRNPHLFKVPSSPGFNQVHSTPDLPCLMLTPNLGLGSAHQLTNASPSVLCTPRPSNQWDSPYVPSEVMSTPFLMKTTVAADCPDLINMIDDEIGSVQAFDHSLRLYESFAETLTESISNYNSPIIQQKVVQAHAQGKYGKQMTETMLEAVRAEQKRKDKIRKELKKEESKDSSSDDRRFHQTISKNGRRTRSILRKCDELGISLPEVCAEKDEE